MAYPVPSHGPLCDVERCFPMVCKYCGRDVIYYECSNGSRVFFDPWARGGGKHVCGPTTKNNGPSRIDRRTGAIESRAFCWHCGQTVKASRIVAHMRKHLAS